MRTSRPAARIGVVIHGPEVIDSGAAQRGLYVLEEIGTVRAVLGGTMGRIAVIDSYLEDRIDISRRRTPSQSLRDLQASSDFLVLFNQAKSRESAEAFGIMVAARAGVRVPLFLADWGAGFVASLSGADKGDAKRLAGALGLDFLEVCPPEGRLWVDGGLVHRRLTGVHAGEPISVGGTVVARATDARVEITARDGRIVGFAGAEAKLHGIEKLDQVDLETSIIRSGEIRRTCHDHRVPARSAKGDGVNEGPGPGYGPGGGDLVIIDHAAEGTLEAAKGASLVITVGDDTTAIAGDILSRLGVPVIGIVDGDLDGLSERTETPAKSTIVRVRPGTDDVVGRRVKEELLGGRVRVQNRYSADELVAEVLRMAGEHLV